MTQSDNQATVLRGPKITGAQISIVLPTFNERENIVLLVEDLLHRFGEINATCEILVIDDRSPDGTAQAVEQAFAREASVKVISRQAEPGLAMSIRDGIEQATGDVILVMDTDFNHEPKDAVLLFQVTRYVDLCVGSRFIFGGGMSSLPRYYLSYVYNIFMRLMLGTRMDDNLSGFFAIRREKLTDLDFDKIFWGYGDYFFRLLLLSQRAKMRHIQVPVYYGERKGGESKTRFTRIFVKYTREVISLAYKKAMGKW
ncbi:glycosyltransferase [Roseobacter litoralis]|uniref:Glycosyltransferase family 2 n=1 Tax=Roseobacter litoralis (strain ATCC 49566 / DSM 6996 / JCM 21268 / NBRC 15278 / OCh 149) TaxID=391595 RepID=F7ZJ73_ROSLO|nr:glycosyltransferase [Roseobacter litoralis]AEI96318.1 putative glycosyltransferase family 2 [Roseobacter litoralis Och 149]